MLVEVGCGNRCNLAQRCRRRIPERGSYLKVIIPFELGEYNLLALDAILKLRNFRGRGVYERYDDGHTAIEVYGA